MQKQKLLAIFAFALAKDEELVFEIYAHISLKKNSILIKC